jgi:hypothetical protein
MIRFLVLLFLTLACLVLAVLMFNGCDPDPYTGPGEGGACEDNEVRCHGELYQLCSSEQRWETLYDCDEFDFVCCLSDVCCELDAGVDGGAISTFLSHGF